MRYAVVLPLPHTTLRWPLSILQGPISSHLHHFQKPIKRPPRPWRVVEDVQVAIFFSCRTPLAVISTKKGEQTIAMELGERVFVEGQLAI